MKMLIRILCVCVLTALLTTSTRAATHTVRVQNLSFVPSNLTVTNGDTVMFEGGNNFHTVTGNSASEPFCGSGFFTTCSVTFNELGTFSYRCIPHAGAGMRGVIRVVSGVLSELTVVIHGQGTVTPDLNGQPLFVGDASVITAVPAADSLFAGWTGGVTSNLPRLSFIMQSNLVLEANFVVNPYPARNQTYNGLFYVEDSVQHDSSGSFRFVLTKTGKYTGTMVQGGKRRAFRGQFGLDGTATNAVKRAGTNDLLVSLSLESDLGAERVEGTVTDPVAGWEAELEGDLAPVFSGTNASPYRGRYTFIVTSEDDVPFGHGFGTVMVDPKGNARLSGTLADGSRVAQSVPLSEEGLCPLYAALYRGKGSILSWVGFSTNPAPAASLYGELSWIKPSLPGKYYPDGFTNEMDIVGSIYLPPKTNAVLELDMGSVTFEGGNLTTPFTNTVMLAPKNQFINLTTNQPLVLKLSPPAGLLNGTVKLKDNDVDKKLSFKGAVLQRQNMAAGFFLSTNQSGSVLLEPSP